MLVPLGAAFGAAWSVWGPGDRDPASGALACAGALFGGWALGRELDPDRQEAAFVAMAGALATALLVPSASLLLLFTTLLLIRVVNRTAGPPATVLDAGGVLGLTAASIHLLGHPGFGVAAAVAFAADTLLGGPRRHLVAAAMAGGLCAWGWTDAAGDASPDGSLPSPGITVTVGLIIVGYVVALARTRRVSSVQDRSGESLDPRRVRWGMGIALLCAVATLDRGDAGVRGAAMLWAVLGATPTWKALRPGNRPRTPP